MAQSYVKSLGYKGVNDGPTCLIAKDNHMYIAGYAGLNSYIKKVDFFGNELWSKNFNFSFSTDIISDLKLDGHFLIGCGYGHDSGLGDFDEFYFKYNLREDKFEWVKRTNIQLKPNNIQILDNGEYLITGDEFARVRFGIFFLTINAETGRKTNYKTWYFSGRESASVSLLDNETLYVGGRYGLRATEDKFRGAISAFDIKTMQQKWSKYYLTGISKYARNYLANISLDGDTLVAAFFTNNMGIKSNYSASFGKFDKNGEIYWAFEYKLKGYSSITVRDMVITEDGYLIYGFTRAPTENLYLLKIDKEGYPLWAKTFGSKDLPEAIAADQGNFITVKDNLAYFVGQSRAVTLVRDFNTVLVRTPLNDDAIQSDCWGELIDVELSSYLDLIEGDINLFQSDTLFRVKNKEYEIFDTLPKNDFLHCLEQVAVNDYDTLYDNFTLTIPFLENDFIADADIYTKEISQNPKHGTATLRNDTIFYTRLDSSDCAIDSLKYTLSSTTDFKSEATVFIYKVIPVAPPIHFALSANDTTLTAPINGEKYWWNDGDSSIQKKISKPGKYAINILKENCVYQQAYVVKENPFSFDYVAFNNTIFILDVSLSMNRSDRLPLLKRAMYNTLEFMRAEDKISIISYASDTRVELSGVAATQIDSIKNKVENLSAGGQSNLNVKNSVQLSFETAKANYIEGGNNRIIFTTDGDISNDRREELKDFIKNKLPENTYFTIFLFNDATLYQKQLGELASYINADLLVITESNMQEVLLNELKAVRK